MQWIYGVVHAQVDIKGAITNLLKVIPQVTLWIRYIKLYKVQEHKIKVEEKC